jgi:hypothetical protein
VALLTPIVKAFITDNGCTSPPTHCMQVFGGHGFIKEWGMEQYVRDNRINMIYEGTNTIQSLDLLGRKVLGNNGATLKKFGKLIGKLVEEEGVNEKMAEFINPIAMLGDQMTKFTTEIGFKGMQNPDEVGAAAVDYLRVAGHLVFGYFCLPAWPRWRCAKLPLATPTRSTPPSCRPRASTLPSCSRNRHADAHRPCRQQGADGHGPGPGLIRRPACTVNFKHFCPGALMYKAVAAIIL